MSQDLDSIEPEHLETCAALVEGALTPYVNRDWTAKAGELEWDVRRTVTHAIGAVAKYTLYLAAGSKEYVALTCAGFEGATQAEIVASIRPVAHGLAEVVRWSGPERTGFHSSGLLDGKAFMALACEELLIHAYDAISAFGGMITPPEDLAGLILRASYPDVEAGGEPWAALVQATGRQAPGT